MNPATPAGYMQHLCEQARGRRHRTATSGQGMAPQRSQAFLWIVFPRKVINENLTVAEIGNSPAMVFKHYRAVVKPEAVEVYWNILPKQEIDVIPMPKAC